MDFIINDIIQLRDGSTYKIIDIAHKNVTIKSVINEFTKIVSKEELTKAFIVEFADPLPVKNNVIFLTDYKKEGKHVKN